MSHTKEPWSVPDGQNTVLSIEFLCGGGELIGSAETEEDARRIVACVNACEGIPIEVLEAMPSGPASLLPMYAQLEAERNRLAAELAEIKKEAETNQKWAFLEWMQKAKDLAAELKELRQRFDKLNHECDGYMDDNKRLAAELDAAKANFVVAHDVACELREALQALYLSCPTGLECNSFHHAKPDRHRHDEECKPRQEYLDAIQKARAALKEKP